MVFAYRKILIVAEWWHGFGRMVAQNWQRNDNDLAERLCYNPNVKKLGLRTEGVLKAQYSCIYNL